MNVWIQAAFLVVFIALVVGILLWLRSADRKLAKLTAVAVTIERNAEQLSMEISAVAEPAAITMHTLREQLEHITPVIEAARRIGESAEQVAQSASRLTLALSEQTAQYVEGGGKYRHHIVEALGVAEAGYAAWQFWQSKRKPGRSSVSSDYDDSNSTSE